MIVKPKVHSRVVEIFSEIFDMELCESITDLGVDDVDDWDSLGQLRLVTEIEEAFQLELSDDEVVSMISLRSVEEVLARRSIEAVPDLLA